MSDIYRKLAECLDNGETVALATIVRVRGSVPREIGTKMIIHPAGRHIGTIGGGCGEADVIKTGLQVIEERRPRLIQVDMTEDVSLESSGICGGIMDVFIDPWVPPNRELLDALPRSVAGREPVALVTVVAAPEALANTVGRKMVVWTDREPLGVLDTGLDGRIVTDAQAILAEGRSRLWSYAVEAGTELHAERSERDSQRGSTLQVFVDVQERLPTLLIVGAGHIAAPLAKLGKLLDFYVTVLDDRPAFANRTRFPEADQIIVDYFESGLNAFPIDSSTYIVLVTRGHQYDIDCLLQVLDSPAKYIGMVGSQRRIRGVFELLSKERGIPAEKLDRVCSPIGLDIGAETPAEIAVAIMAEIVKARRGGTGLPLSDARRRPVHADRTRRRP